MTCPSCFSGELDVTYHCFFCGIQYTVPQELALRSLMPPPATRGLQDEKFDLAVREAG